MVLETVDDERRPAAQLGVETALVEAPARSPELDGEIGVTLLADGPGVEQLEDGCRGLDVVQHAVELAPRERLAQRALGEQRLPLEVALLEFGGRQAEGDHPAARGAAAELLRRRSGEVFDGPEPRRRCAMVRRGLIGSGDPKQCRLVEWPREKVDADR